MFINFLKLFEYLDFLYELLLEISKKRHLFEAFIIRFYFYVMIFETTFQNLVVLIIKIKADIFCYMRFALFVIITNANGLAVYNF